MDPARSRHAISRCSRSRNGKHTRDHMVSQMLFIRWRLEHSKDDPHTNPLQTRSDSSPDTDSHRVRLCRPITATVPSRDPRATRISHAGAKQWGSVLLSPLNTTLPCPQSLGLGIKPRRVQIFAFSSTRLRETSSASLPKLQGRTSVNPKRSTLSKLPMWRLRNPSPGQKPNVLLPNALPKYRQFRQRVRPRIPHNHRTLASQTIRFNVFSLPLGPQASPRLLAAIHPLGPLIFPNIVRMIRKRHSHLNFTSMAHPPLTQGAAIHTVPPLALLLFSLHHHPFNFLRVLPINFTEASANLAPYFPLPTRQDLRRSFVLPRGRTGSASAHHSPDPIYNLKEK